VEAPVTDVVLDHSRAERIGLGEAVLCDAKTVPQLVAVLDQAAELLQYQVDKRLEGAARAQVAARLAMVYLTNRKPDRAISALRTTRIADLSGASSPQAADVDGDGDLDLLVNSMGGGTRVFENDGKGKFIFHAFPTMAQVAPLNAIACTDVNGDGNMVYVEYNCQQGTTTAPGFLYRNQIAWNALVKPATDNSMILLNNVLANPNDQNGNTFPCFQYQTKTVGVCPGVFPSCIDFVTNVEVTLTEQTEFQDPTSKQFQRETKALLNVSPRNVFNAWELDSANLVNRVQPMPPSVTLLLP